MNRRYVEQLRDGDLIDDVYVVAEKQLRSNKNGNPYIQIQLRDRTGMISARMWNVGEGLFRSFDNGDFLQIEGRVQMFQGALQVIANTMQKVGSEKLDLEDFLPRTEADINKLADRLRSILLNLTSPYLRALAEAYFIDDEFVRKFYAAPAGIKLHHAYVGGLLEHTVTMMEIADRLLPLYPAVDRDLVFSGVFLHDAGKVLELSYARTFGYTDDGQLVGHLVMGVEMLNEKIAVATEMLGEPFPKELVVRLKHMILSHHGTLEHGSPKLPMTPEAVMLHQIDSLDTRMHMVLKDIHEDRNNATAWTAFNPTLQRRFYKGGGTGEFYSATPEAYD